MGISTVLQTLFPLPLGANRMNSKKMRDANKLILKLSHELVHKDMNTIFTKHFTITGTHIFCLFNKKLVDQEQKLGAGLCFFHLLCQFVCSVLAFCPKINKNDLECQGEI